MEYWEIYDDQGTPRGYQIPKGQPLKADEYHIAVEAWIVNGQGQVLLQQRSLECELLPGIWGLTTGRLVAGESSCQGCLREIQEELGVSAPADALTFLRRIIRTDGSNLIWDLYLVRLSLPVECFVLQPEEVSQVRWVSFRELRELVAREQVFRYPEMEDVIRQLEAGA